ncbi:MAG TPA: cyclic nucleotide-binding domain-containing protein [Acidimicrobiales bacterium]|nr:cyclic nucleotide-binding domain-containing protein [Acidimicrobiales bacterium]
MNSRREPQRPGGGGLRRRSWVDRMLDAARWDERHERLSKQPVFARCSRAEIRRLATAGDECFVERRTVLCHEGRIGYWFFVVTSGAVRLSQRGRTVATLAAGSHFGDVAILGFGPQPVTATVTSDGATVFILGRRSLLDLSATMRSLQIGLFGDEVVDDSAFVAKVRELRLAGTADWKSVPRRSAHELRAAARVEELPPSLRAVPTRRVSSSPSPFAAALNGAANVAVGGRTVVASRLDGRVLAAVTGAMVFVSAWFAVAFHPPVLVARPGDPIDVTGDVSVDAAVVGVGPPAGRYVATTVRLEEPNLVGLGLARLRGEPTMRMAQGAAASEDRRAGREAYQRSERTAVAVVARRAGLDPSMVRVRLRDRHLSGPSAGLVYALVLADMTRQVDVRRGEVVAATGALEDSGAVRPVGFVEVKREVASRSGAAIFLVPVGSSVERSRGGVRVVEVATLDEALRTLAGRRQSR